MSLFVSTSNLQSYPSECSNLNISDTIERECLSVLHKLHDQVNGLQLVQVVVQPLAKLFNPASLAALATNITSSPANKQSSVASIAPSHGHNISATCGGSHSNASTPSSHIPPPSFGNQHPNDPDGTTVSCDTSHSNQHSRSQSFASSFSVGGSGSHIGAGNSSVLSSTSTYMMSPDTAQALIARLDTDRDVNWLMEIIGYGLSMPFSITGEQDSVKDCCTIYCEWLAATMLPYNEHNEDSKYQQLNKLVPVPIKKEPNRYARKMLSHLYNVFLPRQPVGASLAAKHSNQKEDTDAILTAVSRQAVLCHRVLRTIESIAHNRTNLMDEETWNHLLALLLTVNDKLLSPPTEPDDIGTQLHDRILGVLFDLMLLASSRSIPESGTWRTFHEMCLNWRHRPALVEHWKRITSLLTKRIVSLPKTSSMCADHPASFMNPSNMNPIDSSISRMNYENLSQTWYRFLNLIGNPVELSDPGHISRTDEFYHAACVANNVLDPRQHPCLSVLPQIFLNSMLGLREFIEAFIGSYHQTNIFTRRPSQPEQGQPQQQVSQFKFHPDRPKCNSILHVFGDWLFSAALIGSELCQEIETLDNPADADFSNISGSMTSMASSLTATEMEPPSQGYSPAFRRKQSHQSTTSSHASTSTTGRRRHSKQLDTSGLSNKKITLEPPLTAESFEAGQAEAMSILCKIFSSKSSVEDVSPAYLARFYLCIQHCLNFGSGLDQKSSSSPGIIKRQLLASVLVNSTELLRKDLDGINLLIPTFIKTIELVFECHEKEIPVQPPPRQHSKNSTSRNETGAQWHNVTNHDLRKACILTLVNLLAYPPHFKDLAIRNCLDGTSPTTTFESLRPRLMRMLFVALQTETDSTNMQILFGGLSLAIQDLKSNHLERHSKAMETEGKSTSQGTGLPKDEEISESDNISQNSFVFNSNQGFLIKSLHVTCYLLINTWKHDNSVSLAALEVLTTIARVSATTSSDFASTKTGTNNNNVIEVKAEYMQTTKWICDYICNQCSRPPPAHSRDMHSTIVAAYQCLSVWFYNHPYLLTDENCIGILMEVIELGVSGQKSRSVTVNPTVGVATPTIISKGEKLLKPSSMRVREAAEALLNICLVRTCHDGIKNISACDTELDEIDLASVLGGTDYKSSAKQTQGQHEVLQLDAYKSFKYFSDDNSVIFSLLEASKYELAGRDHLLCLLRTPFGKHCWRFNFNYCSDRSREKIIANKTIGLMKRPFQQTSGPFGDANMAFPFHKGHNRSLYFNKKAKFFPDSIESLPMNDLDRMVMSLDDYVKGSTELTAADSRFPGNLDKMNKIFSHQVLAEQKVVSEFSTRRATGRTDCEEPQPSAEFDATRIFMTHFGLKNRLPPTVTPDDRVLRSFVEKMRTLDNMPIRTRDSVNIFYVRRNRTSLDEILESTRERNSLNLDFFDWLLDLGRPTGSSGASKENLVDLIWTDMCQELIFTIPTKLDIISSSPVIVCWLECSDDMANIPIDSLSNPAGIKLFIHPMKNGLFRVDTVAPHVSPLDDGMTLNKSTLSSLVRESILSLCRRRRLDADSYQPAHVKRRLLLHELSSRQ
uniref:Ral GTPase-activating protein subunit beta n=1 Tax=Aceria tosichella TaxID=561515 RepID=A0A6G1SRK1_9ACAR